LREVSLDIGDQVANANPGRGHIAALRAVAQVDEDRGFTGDRDAPGVIERFELFELLFDTLGDLACDFVGGRARPLRLDHHGFDGEIGVFLAPELQVGEQARSHEGDHEIPDERTMSQRPVGEIERLHGFWSP
jgi:hypothetical protein